MRIVFIAMVMLCGSSILATNKKNETTVINWQQWLKGYIEASIQEDCYSFAMLSEGGFHGQGNGTKIIIAIPNENKIIKINAPLGTALPKSLKDLPKDAKEVQYNEEKINSLRKLSKRKLNDQVLAVFDAYLYTFLYYSKKSGKLKESLQVKFTDPSVNQKKQEVYMEFLNLFSKKFEEL